LTTNSQRQDSVSMSRIVRFGERAHRSDAAVKVMRE